MANDDLIKTFETLAQDHDAMANEVEVRAMRDPGLTETVQYLRARAEECRQKARGLREGRRA